MKIEYFVDSFCGPDCNAFETLKDSEIRTMADLYRLMRDHLKQIQAYEPDIRVDMTEAVELFCSRLLDDIQDLNENK